jgi:hypothetical protein
LNDENQADAFGPGKLTCVTAVRSGSTTNVRFTAQVNCSGNNTCLVDLSNVNGPVIFFGEPGVTAGFLRTDTYTYSILNLNGASNITFANLTFDEGPADPACAPYEVNGSYTYPCEPTIYVGNSSHVVFEQVSVLHSKDIGIAFAATQGITIQDSVIEDAGVDGNLDGSESLHFIRQHLHNKQLD